MTDKPLDFYWNCMSSLLWQYENSTALKTLLEYREQFYNKSTKEFFTDFINNVLNLDTANTFGLTIWGRILKLERPKYTNSEGKLVSFNDDQYKLLLRAKMLKLHKRPTPHNINIFLETLFPTQGLAFCQDRLDMTTTYILGYVPEDWQRAVMKLEDFWMRPAGVKTNIVPIPPESTFGFAGSGLQPWNQGVFVEFGTQL